MTRIGGYSNAPCDHDGDGEGVLGELLLGAEAP